MILKETLRQIVSKQKNELFPPQDAVKRELLESIQPWLGDQRVVVLTGVRRCGKSTLLKQLMENASAWCYVNFEDERLLDFRAQDFELLNEVLVEVYGPPKMYFFDEVQNIEKFETFVRRLQDEGKKVIITGSNATLLSREFGTRLTGRYKAFEVYPFSFTEFLAFKMYAIEKNDFYDIGKKIRLLKLFAEYLSSGGFPEYLRNQDREYLRVLYENVLYRDIITRYSVKRERIIKELVNILATNATSPFTYNALRKTLGLSNAITVKEYISYLHNAYLFFEVLRFAHSIKLQMNAPRKIYLVDSAFNQVCGLNFTPNRGRNLENVVFLQLKRAGKEVYYYANRSECDFVVKEGTRITAAVQVCHTLNDANRQREIGGLLEAMHALKLKTGMILTFEQTEELHIGEKKISILPVFRWLCE